MTWILKSFVSASFSVYIFMNVFIILMDPTIAVFWSLFITFLTWSSAMFNFKSSSFSRFGTVPRAPSIMGTTWYLNPGYICCSSDINGTYLSALFLWRLAMLKSSGTLTMSGLLCSILFGVCKGLSHQISLVGVLMTGSGQSILGCWSSLITSFSITFATGLCLAVVYRLEDISGQLPTTQHGKHLHFVFCKVYTLWEASGLSLFFL